MKTNQRGTFALLIATATLAAGVASAQTTTMPAPATASGPMTRDAVKQERDAAMKNGTKPMGAADITADRPKGGPEVKKSSMTGKTRDEVKSETKQAAQTGDMPMGEADISKNHLKGGAKGHDGSSMSSGKSRQGVKADTTAANKMNEIPKGEANVTADAPKGGVPNKP